MKQILFLLSFVFPFLAFSQEKPYKENTDGSITFERILQAESKSADVLYSDIQGFFATNYADAKNVIQAQNEEQYFIIGKGIFPKIISWTNSMIGEKYILNVPHTVRIDCKDVRVRVQYTVSEYEQESGNWVNFESGYEVSTYPISSKYPIKPSKKQNKLNKEEKRYNEAFSNLTGIIEQQFNAINEAINTNNQDW